MPRADVVAALARAEAALRDDPAGSDVIFWLAQAGMKTGRQVEPPLHPLIEQGRNGAPMARAQYELWRMRRAVLPRAPKVMHVPERYVARVTTLEQEQQLLPVVLQVMTQALVCRSRLEVVALAGEPGIGYVSTHQLLALMLATSRGCLTVAQFERGVGPYVRRVYSEMLRDGAQPIDVQVERIAVLVLAGRSDLVPREHLDRLMAQQAADGLWHFGVPPRHTSALAYVALSSLLLPQDFPPGPAAEAPDWRGVPLKRSQPELM